MKPEVRPVVAVLVLLLVACPSTVADEARLVVQPSEIDLDPGAEVVITPTLVEGDDVLDAAPWHFRFAADAGQVSGNLYKAPSRPGRYRVRVVHRQSGRQGTVRIDVRLPRPAVRLEIVPAAAELAPGERFAFRAVAIDADGAEMDVAPEWSSTAAIDGAGLLVAPDRPGTHTVRASGPGALEATAEVRVVVAAGAVEELLVEPSGIEVDPGRTLTLTVRRRVGDRTVVVAPWQVAWRVEDGTLRGNVWTAPEAAGEYVLEAESGDAVGEARIRVRRIVAPVARIAIEPAEVTVRPGGEVVFRATGKAGDGSVVGFVAQWRTTAGSVDPNGRFVAPDRPGPVDVFVTDEATRLSARATVRVVIPRASQLVLVPGQVAIRPGETVRFEARGRDADGHPAPVDVVWQATGGSIESGEFTAGAAYGSEFRVVARDRGTDLTAAAKVAIHPHPIDRLTLEPPTARLPAGRSIDFRAAAVDAAGRPVPAELEWSATGGAIDGEGRFVAPEAAGRVEVTVVDARSGKRSRAVVTILPPAPARLVLDPSSARVEPGRTVRFAARVLDEKGRDLGASIEWRAKGGTIDGEGLFTAGSATGPARVVAREASSGLEAEVAIEIVRPDVWTLRLEPAGPQVEVEVGGRIEFRPVLENNGQPIGGATGFLFEADGARIGTDGVLVAPAAPGSVAVRVRHPATGTEAAVAVRVTAPAPASIVVEPPRLELAPGQSARVVARVLDAAGRPLDLRPEFRAEGGTIDGEGLYTAGDVPGERYRIHAYLREPRIVAQVEVVVRAVEYLVRLEPSRVEVAPGETVTFQPTLESDGQRVYAWPWSFRFEADGGRFQEHVYRAPTEVGSYEIRVAHERGSARAVVVVVPGPVASIEIAPDRARVKAGQSTRFEARAVDLHGNEVETTFEWRATGGRIEPDGLFTAPAMGGGSFEVTAGAVTAGAAGSRIVGRASVEIEASREATFRLAVGPDRVEVGPGEEVAFDVVLYREDEKIEFWPWELEFRSSAGTIKGGRFTAPDRPGTYEVEVRHQKARATVTVVVRPVERIARIVIDPPAVTLEPGARQAFTAVATDARGRAVAAEIQWTAFGGTIDGEGNYQAPAEMGNCLVTASVAGSSLDAVARVRVVPPEAVRLSVEPAEATIGLGASVELTVKLLEGDSERMVWPWDLEFKPEAGRMEESTYVAPARPGSYRIEVVHPRARATVTVHVRAPAVVRMELSPQGVRLKPGETQSFQATLFNERGSEVHGVVEWKATGGQIDQRGRYTAGDERGTFTVDCLEPQSGVTASVEVAVWVETRYLGLGRRWGEQVRQGKRGQNDLINYVIASIFFRSRAEIAEFRQGFLEAYGERGEAFFESSWQTVLFEFGRYYGREVRRQTIGLDEAARFVGKQVLTLDAAALEAFRKGFLAGHTLGSAADDYERILRRARR